MSLGIPVLGGSLVKASGWIVLGVMLVLHNVCLILAIKAGRNKVGHIMGIVTSCVAFIPIVGMVMHIITAVLLIIEAAKKN